MTLFYNVSAKPARSEQDLSSLHRWQGDHLALIPFHSCAQRKDCNHRALESETQRTSLLKGTNRMI